MRVFVSVGTDHHPFDRLVGWADRWAADHPDDRVVVQYGTSGAPRHGEGSELLGSDRMREELARADVVVISCGPGGVMDARAAGRIPLAVARRHDLGEHVDDHQLAFARLLAERGLARWVQDEAGFRALLQAVTDDPGLLRLDPAADPEGAAEPAGIRRIGGLIDDLVYSRDPLPPDRA